MTGLLENIGGTPLLSLPRLASELPRGVELYAKAEHLNPGGSVKDRPALSMILDGERSGALTPEKTILDATSGNTGIAYAMIGAARELDELGRADRREVRRVREEYDPLALEVRELQLPLR